MSVSFRVGFDAAPLESERDYQWRVYDSNGWCRGLARTKKLAEQIRRELEAGTLSSPIIDPVRR